jgi:prophage antirepressor-like protein
MSNQMIPFSFENRQVRMALIDGQEWWVGKDVAESLGYKDTANAIKQHCKGVAKHHPLQTGGGKQEVRIISEGDVFRLITHSNLPEAQRFEKWLFEEVLPQIRRTGSCDGAGKAAEAFLIIRYLEEENKSLRREIRRYETRNFLTAGDKIDIVTLRVQEYPVSAIQKITKKGRKRIKDFLDGFFSLSEKEWDAELESWYKAAEDKGGAE